MLSHPSLTREDQLTSHYNMMRSNAFKKSDTQNRSTTTKTWLSLYTLLWLAHPLLISVSTHQQFWKRESLFILYEKNWLNKEIYLLYLYLVVVIYDSKNNSHFFLCKAFNLFNNNTDSRSIWNGSNTHPSKKHIVCRVVTQYIVVPKVNYNYKL